MKILVTGSDGLVGTNIVPALRRSFEVIPAIEKEWDITDLSSGDEVMRRFQPDVLLNLAAVTNVDGCEDNPGPAWRVNAEGPGVLAELARRYKAQLIQLSTDYVFDGTKGAPYAEQDITNPLSVYGMTKCFGEQAVLEKNPFSLVIRTEWIYGEGGQHFISKVLAIAREKGAVEVVNDQTGSPTYARDLARPIAALIQGKARGIYHVTNSGACTWFRFAKEIFSILGMDVKCRPIDSVSSPRKARRPGYSVFDLKKLKGATGISMRDWREALAEHLRGADRLVQARLPQEGRREVYR